VRSTLRAPTEAEVEAFDRDGVVALRGVVPFEWVDRCRAGLDEAFARPSASPISEDVTASAEAAAAEGRPTLGDDERRAFGPTAGRFLVASGTWTWNASLRAVATESVLPAIAAGLTRSAEIRFYDDQVLLKEPRCAEFTAFHTDEAYWKISGEQVCVLWFPVDVVTADSSAMRYVRGSHRWPGRYGRKRFFDGTAADPSVVRDELPDIGADERAYDIVTVEAEPGDLLAHHYRTVHGSRGNSTDRVRRAASFRYVGEDVRYRWKPSPDKPYHEEGHLRDGDPLDDEHYPVVWRAEDPEDAGRAP